MSFKNRSLPPLVLSVKKISWCLELKKKFPCKEKSYFHYLEVHMNLYRDFS